MGTAEVLFDPTAGEDLTDEQKKKLLEHCVYLWDVKTADDWWKSMNMKPLGLTGKAICKGHLETINEADAGRFVENLVAKSVKFMQAVVHHVNSS